MHPVLFTVGNFPVASYGVLVGAGIFFGTALATRQAKRDGLDPSYVWDVGVIVVLSVLIGGRAEFVRTHWSQFRDDLGAILHLREGGMVFYGGFITAVVAISGYAALRRMPALAMLDTLAPWVMFGQGIGRIGCFAAGCCYGAPTGLPWGVTFPPGSVAPAGVALHPTQLYESAYTLVIAALLALWPRRFVGQRFAAMLALYGAARFANEYLRGDARRGWALEGWLTNAQVTSMVMLLAAGGIVVWAARRARTSAPSAIG